MVMVVVMVMERDEVRRETERQKVVVAERVGGKWRSGRAGDSTDPQLSRLTPGQRSMRWTISADQLLLMACAASVVLSVHVFPLQSNTTCRSRTS